MNTRRRRPVNCFLLPRLHERGVGRPLPIVAPGDPAAFASAIVDLRQYEEKRKLLGSAALVVDGYSAKQMTSKDLRIYEDSIAEVITAVWELPSLVLDSETDILGDKRKSTCHALQNRHWEPLLTRR